MDKLSGVLRSPSLAAASGLLLLAFLSGCASAGDTATTETTPIASPEVTDAQPAPAVQPTVPPIPDTQAALDCTTMLTPDAYAAFDERGLEHRPNVTSYPPPAGVELVSDGALECLWDVPPGDSRVWIARLVEPEEAWNVRVAELAPAGWTAADGTMTGALVRYPEWDEELQPAIAHVDGVTYFAEPGGALRSIAAVADRFAG